MEVILGQLETAQRDLSIKEVELKHLTLQLELLTSQNAAHVNELQEQIAALKVDAIWLISLNELNLKGFHIHMVLILFIFILSLSQ